MAKQKKRLRSGVPIILSLLGMIGLGVLIVLLTSGSDMVLFNPKGTIANEQLRLLIIATALLLEIGIPTLVILYYVAWKYRETNEKAEYNPDTTHHRSFIYMLWGIPTLFMLLMVAVLVPATHRLEPQKAIVSDSAPLTIQVVAMRWKWLFIYPDQKIATVNYVQIPVDTPVRFELTADEAPMSSFWIPHLGGQLYAMTGHMNRLNLMADTVGEYQGSTAEINGKGFAEMKFITRASTIEDFNTWVAEAQKSPSRLSASAYKELLEPSQKHPAKVYSSPLATLYGNIILKNSGSHQHYTEHK